MRDNGNAGVDLDSPFDGLDVIELHGVLHSDVLLSKDFVDSAPGGDVRLEANEFLPTEFREAHRFGFGERMSLLSSPSVRTRRVIQAIQILGEV